ncbi:MAG: hypothetical protein DRR19_01540 [Candidatus Parabeggiatoa sp. nov. 1]|nr:MAG: hypothetical protein DRR19_01540 [Gammaproteobacteria bacterium]
MRTKQNRKHLVQQNVTGLFVKTGQKAGACALFAGTERKMTRRCVNGDVSACQTLVNQGCCGRRW